MITSRVLDQIFSRRTSIIVLRALRNYASGISGREVARITGLAPKNSINTLTHLENLGLVNRIRGGREHLFSLNRESYLIQNSILPLLESEDEFERSIRKEIKTKLKGKVVSALIFGSVARGEETEESDFDLCLVYETSKERKALEELINSIGNKMNRKYGISVSPLYITKAEFLKKARSGKSPVKQIIKEGELIVGENIKRIINA